jgi:hypothetical protein
MLDSRFDAEKVSEKKLDFAFFSPHAFAVREGRRPTVSDRKD